MHGRLHIFPHPEQVAEHRLEIDWHRIAAMVFRCISKMKREQEVGNNCSSQIVVGSAMQARISLRSRTLCNACLSNFQRCVIDSFLNNDKEVKTFFLNIMLLSIIKLPNHDDIHKSRSNWISFLVLTVTTRIISICFFAVKLTLQVTQIITSSTHSKLFGPKRWYKGSIKMIDSSHFTFLSTIQSLDQIGP